MKRMLITVVVAAAIGAGVSRWTMPKSDCLSGVAQVGDSVADAVDKVMPSVAVVRTAGVQYEVQRDWLGVQYRVPRKLSGQGSAVIFDEAGYLLTSHHVVKDAQQLEVVLSDGRTYAATVVGVDAITDLAVLKIDADEKLAAIQVANSDAVRVGEMAIAIGSPFALQGSVTAGIVSQKGRAVGLLPYEDFIQTDAPINPGNSGGPLVNSLGNLIGINTAIQSEGGQGNIGIAFSVPANLAIDVARSIVENGKHEWPWIGVGLGEFADRSAGVPILEVWNHTPAQKAAMLPGDVILKVDGRDVQTVREVQSALLGHKVGECVKLILSRRKTVYEVRLETMSLPNKGDQIPQVY